MTVNGLLDLPVDQLQYLIYVYKITCNYTGHFYIGQTNSLKDRMYKHLTFIEEVINKSCDSPQKFHKIVAEAINTEYEKDKRKKITRFIRESLSVYVLAIVSEREAALNVESYYINKHRTDELCLNVS